MRVTPRAYPRLPLLGYEVDEYWGSTPREGLIGDRIVLPNFENDSRLDELLLRPTSLIIVFATMHLGRKAS